MPKIANSNPTVHAQPLPVQNPYANASSKPARISKIIVKDSTLHRMCRINSNLAAATTKIANVARDISRNARRVTAAGLFVLSMDGLLSGLRLSWRVIVEFGQPTFFSQPYLELISTAI